MVRDLEPPVRVEADMAFAHEAGSGLIVLSARRWRRRARASGRPGKSATLSSTSGGWFDGEVVDEREDGLGERLGVEGSAEDGSSTGSSWIGWEARMIGSRSVDRFRWWSERLDAVSHADLCDLGTVDLGQGR